jgi:hypothetical protein
MELKINYGLIVMDPSEPGDQKTILHFCGYQEPISDRDVESLREELKNDPEFGLQDKWDKVVIVEAPDEILKEYQDAFSENSERESA